MKSYKEMSYNELEDCKDAIYQEIERLYAEDELWESREAYYKDSSERITELQQELAHIRHCQCKLIPCDDVPY